MNLITLTTDFGNSDPFVGIMKGVILNICPNARIIDLTHSISPQNINQANFILKSSYCYFPKGTIHVCIVDPGVGSSRKPILIKTKDYFFIGPNNGLFSFVVENIVKVIELTEKKYWLKNRSQTFHGRDIFAPVAAHLARREKIDNFGNQFKKENLIKATIPKLIKNKNRIIGSIQYIDCFGNIITNIPNSKLPKRIHGKVKAINFNGLLSSYSKAKPNKLHAIQGRQNFLELFINLGSAAKLSSAKVGDKVEITF